MHRPGLEEQAKRRTSGNRSSSAALRVVNARALARKFRAFTDTCRRVRWSSPAPPARFPHSSTMSLSVPAPRIAAVTAGVAALGFVSYALYFDYRRRHDPVFRKNLSALPPTCDRGCCLVLTAPRARTDKEKKKIQRVSQQQAEQGRTQIIAALRRALALINSEAGTAAFARPRDSCRADNLFPTRQSRPTSRRRSSTSWSRSASASSSRHGVSRSFTILP